ncbi:lysylphosphatidylglycerol synthase domain-containing protein [Methylocella tundrae]|nr:lysylphosphatidylglycerol synthase domain-containing protein [Methylocella tundrae]WPP03709.1 lysylphosphatidylglycerol synthase domain-containing protein [Methylocella tundrae]
MKRILDFVWPAIGLLAVGVSLFVLYQEFRGQHIGPELWRQLRAIPPSRYLLAIASTLVAYGALAWYDRIALRHLGVTHISWAFVALCSFTTYALAHNIGASVFSGGMVRYRAYHSKGLNAAQVAVLVALCSLTFGLGTILVGGLILVFEPDQLARFGGLLPDVLTNPATAFAIGAALLILVAAYLIGSIFRLKPLIIRGFRLEYPKPDIAVRQLLAAPLELLGAAGIIYFALPAAGNPGFFAVLAVFVASFSAALASNAPGGLGVFELLFLKAMPATPQVEVLTALLVWRLFYLILPLLFSLVVVVLFERNKLKEALHHEAGHAPTEVGGAKQPGRRQADVS